MTVITVATNIESRAIIDKFALKKMQNPEYKIYSNNELLLIITNIGIKNAKKATEYIVKYLGKDNINHIFNIGIAGCVDTTIKIGSIYFINKIIDQTNNIILTNHMPLGFDKCSISSFNHNVMQHQRKDIKSKLVDMEAIGFFKIASTYMQEDNISIIKVVSDYLLENNTFSKHIASKIMNDAIYTLANHIRKSIN